MHDGRARASRGAGAGVEIGPTLHHPRFHLLLTIDHWSYIQIDTFCMKAVLEQMFKGTHRVYQKTFELLGSERRPGACPSTRTTRTRTWTSGCTRPTIGKT